MNNKLMVYIVYVIGDQKKIKKMFNRIELRGLPMCFSGWFVYMYGSFFKNTDSWP